MAPDSGKTYSARQAAAVVDVDARTIRRAIAAGDLPAERTDSGFVIGGGDLRDWAQRRSATASTTSTSDASASTATDDRRVVELEQRVAILEAVVAEERRRAQDERDRAARAEQAAGLWQGRAEGLQAQIAMIGNTTGTTAEPTSSTTPASSSTRPAGLWQRLRRSGG